MNYLLNGWLHIRSNRSKSFKVVDLHTNQNVNIWFLISECTVPAILRREYANHPTLVWPIPNQGDPFEFRRQTYQAKSWGNELIYSENCMIIQSFVIIHSRHRRLTTQYDNSWTLSCYFNVRLKVLIKEVLSIPAKLQRWRCYFNYTTCQSLALAHLRSTFETFFSNQSTRDCCRWIQTARWNNNSKLLRRRCLNHSSITADHSFRKL